ncbi:kinectin isoform X4 [Poeciliopsis prolifica]|uniref:kinectin isoform X4 n=1 Tax=Poeciliopsis prolifica TaxID=188132 RepID=UPI002413C827|nr:kinectin isoform X4 [Poeciliopsis prolifica]
MAMDIYDSQYLLILAPTLVIALMFLFFWLFMKETSYDEVLARQKRDLKLPPTKPDSRKKNEKKKSKKKESAGGGSGGGGGESEEDLREIDLTDGIGSNMEAEKEPESVGTPDPSPPAPAAEVSVSPEATSGLRERKKKEKKAAKAAAKAAAAAASNLEESEMNDSKPVSHKTETSPTSGKRINPPPPLVETQVQVQAVQAPVQTQTPPQTSGKKKDRKKQKVEAADVQQLEVKAEQAPAPSKKEAPSVAETKVLDGANPMAVTGKKKNSAKKQKTEHVVEETHILGDASASNHQVAHNDDVPPKASAKKQKNETDKAGNTEVKLKELLSGLSSLALSEAEAISVIALLREKSPTALEAWNKSTARPDPAAQEREKLLVTLQEESSIAKDKVKQLSQELQLEKQKTGRMEAMVREQRVAMEKELGGMQAKAQGSYQELQNMQKSFQQVREQLEAQITRLQQENGILRDAVSSATTQMESKNSAELNKLRSEYAGLMKELADNNSKLQQEEHQRKSLEVNYKQNVSQLEAQLQDAKRSWEELQNFLHNVNAEREKLQASKQDLHSQLLAAETEMNNKNKELQTLHSNLNEAMLSKEQLERRVMELMDMSQRSVPDETVQAQVQELKNENKALQAQNEAQKSQNENLQAQISSQAKHVSHIEELQKLLSEKELQRKSLEDSLNAERSSGASRETNMQTLHNENLLLKAEIQNLQAQITEQKASQLALDQIQKSVQEKEENMKTVEGLLEEGLIQVANKETELKSMKVENEALRREIDDLNKKKQEQATSELKVEELQKQIQEKDVKLKSMEENLQAAQASSSTMEKMVETLQQQLSAHQQELEKQRQAQQEIASYGIKIQELQSQLAAKDQEIQRLQTELKVKTKDLSEKVEQIQQQSISATPSPEFLATLSEKENQVDSLQVELAELKDTLELHRKKNNELREKNWSAMEALSATESMLQGKLSKAVKESQTALAQTQAECRDVLHRLLPHVPLPSEQNHQEWLQRFETAVAESLVTQVRQTSQESEELAEKLKEAEETQRILQKDCETYKKVLAETEGILQRLQSCVEEEESRWKVKLEQSQEDVRELRREKQHLESELERAENESATYVTEVRELKDLLTELQTRLDGSYTEAFRQNEELALLKTQLSETLSRLQTEENERQRVAGDLYKAQQSLEQIQSELTKLIENNALIENSSLSSQHEEIDKKERITAGLNQTVREMQQLLIAISQQLAKGETEKDQQKV